MSRQRSTLLGRLRTYVALILVPALLAACMGGSGWKSASIRDLKPDPVNRVRFYPADEPQNRVELQEAQLIGDSLVGFEFEREHPTPLRRAFSSQRLISLERKLEPSNALWALAGVAFVGSLIWAGSQAID